MTRWNLFVSCRALPIAAALFTAALSFAAAPAAHAEILQLSATAFTPRGTSILPATQGEVVQGMLGNATGKYYATVPFPVGGAIVCRFSLVYSDSDADQNITARLLRKNLNLGGTAFTAPVLMAGLTSTGAVNAMRRASTVAIASPVISPAAAFYYVELELPISSLEAVGVQIMHRTTCP